MKQRTNDNSGLRKGIKLLATTNLLDGVLTFIGLKVGAITEKNPLLSSFVPEVILTIKIVLTLMLLTLLKTNFVESKRKIWFFVVLLVNVLYMTVLVLHLIWIVLYF